LTTVSVNVIYINKACSGIYLPQSMKIESLKIKEAILGENVSNYGCEGSGGRTSR
jgi:hypothetical protein